MIDWILEPLQYAFMQRAMAASLLISLTCAFLGVHVVHRRMAFLGDAIAHTTLPGLVIAWLNRWNLIVGAVIAALLTAFGIGWVTRKERVGEDTAIGVLFSGMLALGIVLISRARSYRDFTHMLFGNVLGVSNLDLLAIVGVSAAVLLALYWLRKELMLTAVDPTHARVIGLSPERIRQILLVLMALTIVTAIQAVGVVLTSAMLVTPAATASLISKRFRRQFAISGLISVICSITGLYASYYAGVSSGGSIVLICTCFFGGTLLLQPLWLRIRQ